MDSAPKLTVSEVLLNSTSVSGWAADNVWHPIANTLAIEPHNAISSSVNDLSAVFGGNAVLDNWKPLHIPKAQAGSKEWLAQNVSSGVAMVVPYGIAALCTRGVLRSAGTRFGATGATEVFLNSRATATILGGTTYDFLKKPHENETRVGNALGATLGFSIFEGGNMLSKGQTGAKLVVMRSLTGSIGAMSQHSLSKIIATGKLPKADDLYNAALTGATMNNLLPAFHDKLNDMSNSVSLARGKGIPIEDYMKQTEAAKESPTLNQLAAENPLARVQPGEAPAKLQHGPRLISVPGAGDHALPKIGHELAHLSLKKQAEPLFGEAAQLLANGKTTEAQAKYVEARTQQESGALAAERQVATELGLPTEPAKPFQPGETKAQSGQTYAELWALEFEKFKESKGTFRPEIDFRPGGALAGADWSGLTRSVADLPAERKVEIARNLQLAPESAARSIFGTLLKDPNPAVRAEAVRNIGALPSGQRAKAWYQAFGAPDPALKAIALEVVSQLPAADRYAAWNHAHSQLRTLPAESGTGESRAAQLVKAIEQLPNRDRQTAWDKALQTSETSRSAAENIAVLPESKRGPAWQMLLREGKAGTDTLLKQIPELGSSDRAGAFSALIRQSRNLNGDYTTTALQSLPEAVRFEHWRKLLSLTEATEQSPVFEALAAIPDPGIKSAAWHDAFAKIGKANGESATKAIPDLPVEARSSALLRVMADVPNRELPRALTSIPAIDLPQVQKAIAAMSPSETRAGMAKSLPIYRLAELPLIDRIAAAQEVFKKAAENPDVFTPEALRHWWWHLLPEEGNKDITALRHEQPVREALAASLSEHQLASIIFAEDPALGSRMAAQCPEAVRSVARNFSTHSEASLLHLRQTAARYVETGSLLEATKTALELNAAAKTAIDPPVADLFGGLSARAERPALTESLVLLSQQVRDANAGRAQADLAIAIAASMRSTNPALFDSQFLKPLERTIGDHTVHPQKRYELASELARLSREGRLGDSTIRMPSSRTETETKLSAAQQALLRAEAEGALADPARLKSLIESGKLAEAFPGTFEINAALAERMTKLACEMQSNPEFAKLAPVDQVNLMWAALIHESAAGKQPVGPHTSWGTAADAYSVLQGLGYPPERVQRIATLISRHTELAPGEANRVIADPAQAFELGLYYRHPEALRQIGILNQAKLTLAGQAVGDVQGKINEINAAIEAAQAGLALPQFPLLLSEIPAGFGLRSLPGDWRLLGHTSPYITSSFLRQLPLMESPHYAMSTSLLNPKHLYLYNPEARLVALITAPSENVVTAARGSFTGTNVDWARVVRDSASLAEQSGPVARDVNAALGKLASTTPGAPRNLTELNRALAQTSNLSGLPENSPLRKAVETVYRAMCTEDGRPLRGHNEAKVVNPTFTGLGIRRGGKPVMLEGVSDPAVLAALMGGEKPPEWVKTTGGTPDAIVIPEAVWRELLRRNKPIVTLD
ncbi:MAG: hypothetical protein K2W95_05920 [Candidatus Obscuribacterales bacterium]|nr:hypothetical protein [Candidatus Obscuribacterales bacterium]